MGRKVFIVGRWSRKAPSNVKCQSGGKKKAKKKRRVNSGESHTSREAAFPACLDGEGGYMPQAASLWSRINGKQRFLPAPDGERSPSLPQLNSKPGVGCTVRGKYLRVPINSPNSRIHQRLMIRASAERHLHSCSVEKDGGVCEMLRAHPLEERAADC
ncbi:hypothetical protein FISHEDRAFT_57417 [Fistulina hepatica ATCC 64428]|uniref:Uncharacterized protein n=1 Tax=Fistulina hepatica ATCC 64428 TaxID=1128425 RepID=A0A0D7AH40_9AGAR|nr:hypothetical protein FISHEDRAFT_57417 [Fistulina hepatica ATCC 64428]